MINQNDVTKWLQEVEHPAKGDKNLVELGMIENIEVAENKISVTLGFAKHRDPLAEYLIGSAKAAIIRNAPAGTEVEIKAIVKEAAPAKKKPGLDLGFEEVAGIKHIIGIASGKGGVGKSVAERILHFIFGKGFEIAVAYVDALFIFCVVYILDEVTNCAVQLSVERVVERLVGVKQREIIHCRLCPVIVRYCRWEMAARVYITSEY